MGLDGVDSPLDTYCRSMPCALHVPGAEDAEANKMPSPPHQECQQVTVNDLCEEVEQRARA